MLTSPEALFAILGMALATFAIKAGGLLLANRLPRAGFAAAWLSHIPGAVLASLVAPAIFTQPLQQAITAGDLAAILASATLAEPIAAMATALVYIVTRNLFAAMATGVATIFLVRMALGA